MQHKSTIPTRFNLGFSKQLLTVAALWLGSSSAWAQLGGKSNFGLLNTPQSALVTAIGGQNVSNYTDDPTLQLSNPALLNDKMHTRAAFTYTPWFNYANTGVSYAHHLAESGFTVGSSVLYNNYGTFKGADAAGNPTGDFTASDIALAAGIAQKRGNFSLGANVKLAHSQIANYNATAVAVDMGVLFIKPDNDFRAGLVVKNIGLGVTNYVTGSAAVRTPLDVQAGVTYKLKHMPLRFSATAHSLATWDVVYQNPNAFGSNDPAFNTGNNDKPFFDLLARRIVLGGEFLLGKGFHARVGYNHMINRELRMEQAGGASGFSIGAMARIKAFELSYTQAIYHAQGSTGMITIGIDMQRLAKGSQKATAAPGELPMQQPTEVAKPVQQGS